MFLATIPHTGTHYFRAQLPLDRFEHFRHDTLDAAKGYEGILATTHRDPLRVAASWANNGIPWVQWPRMWGWYNEFIKLGPLVFDMFKKEQHGFVFDEIPRNQNPDRLGIHAALDRGDVDYFAQHIPGAICLTLL